VDYAAYKKTRVVAVVQDGNAVARLVCRACGSEMIKASDRYDCPKCDIENLRKST
jgi:Zn finger protein HypA/HybF involved in hydrogenase expression